VDYTLYQNQLKKKAEEEAQIEKQAFESIDWHDFVVVETIEFSQADQEGSLPLPMELAELETIRLTRTQDLPDNTHEQEETVEDEEEEMEMDME
jgi:splicing factor 3A subunit 1